MNQQRDLEWRIAGLPGELSPPTHDLKQDERAFNRTAQKRGQGFSLIELMIAVAILMLLAAILTPLISYTPILSDRLERTATKSSHRSGEEKHVLLRRQTTLSTGVVAYYVDLGKNNTLAAGDPLVALNQVNVHSGTGAGAPSEATFATSLNFALDSSGVLPKFNARGLPCLPAGGTCPQIPGKGFIYFLSRNTGLGTGWASVVVTPSGRVQAWTYDGTNWGQI
jgi:prepilin-type N-terminal cleavage/methylation domain-containing protein